MGCKKDTGAPNFHFDYFGLEEGRYVIYDVLEIDHDIDATIQHDTSEYQLKTVWGEIYYDNEGRKCRKFRRYILDTLTNNWMLKDTWYGLIDNIRAELVEENQRVIKLVFAPSQQKEWDANAYNTFEEIPCYYENIHKEYTINNTLFDSTVTVEQANEANLIDTIRKYEIYAKGVGLIYKHFKENDYQFTNTPHKGRELYYSFVSSGIE